MSLGYLAAVDLGAAVSQARDHIAALFTALKAAAAAHPEWLDKKIITADSVGGEGWSDQFIRAVEATKVPIVVSPDPHVIWPSAGVDRLNLEWNDLQVALGLKGLIWSFPLLGGKSLGDSIAVTGRLLKEYATQTKTSGIPIWFYGAAAVGGAAVVATVAGKSKPKKKR